MSCLEKKMASTQKVSTRLSLDRIPPTQPRLHLPSSAQIPGWSQAVGLMGQQGGPQGMLLHEGASVPGQTPGAPGPGVLDSTSAHHPTLKLEEA